jgi:hypothetical protein
MGMAGEHRPAQTVLHHPVWRDVDTVLQQVGREAVPQGVRPDPLGDPGRMGRFGGDAVYLPGENGRFRVDGWVPRWMAFPPASYTRHRSEERCVRQSNCFERTPMLIAARSVTGSARLVDGRITAT